MNYLDDLINNKLTPDQARSIAVAIIIYATIFVIVS